MHLQVHRMRVVANLFHLRRRIHRPSPHIHRIFHADQCRLRVVINFRPNPRLHLLPRQNPVFAPHGSRHAPRNRGHGRQLVQIHMAPLFADHFIAVMRPHFDRDEIPHAARRHKQRRFFPENLCRPPLQPVDRRIFSIHVVADLGFRHRPPHLHRRTRHRIATQIHHSRRNLAHVRQLIRIHPLIPLRHRITHIRFSPYPLRPLCLWVKLSFFLNLSAPQTLHSTPPADPWPAAPLRHPAPPIPPSSTDQTATPMQLHTPARSAPSRFHPTAVIPKTIPPRAHSPPSTSLSAPPATLRPAPRSHTPPRHAHWPIAPSQKTNAPRPQIPNTPPASNTLHCASIRIPALPNSKSRNGDTLPPATPSAPSHKTPPFRPRLAPSSHYTAPRRAATRSPAGSPRQSPANKSKRAPARAPATLPAIVANSLSSGAAIPQSNQN